MTEYHKLIKEAVMQIGAGGTAGLVEICIMQPLDVVKTRLQLQATSKVQPRLDDPYHYRGVADCLRKIYRYEGLMAMWKGILPPILSETPKKAIKFLTFEQYKKLFLFGSNKPTPLTFCLAGLSAGITEAFVVNPFEVVKVTLQSNKAQATQAPSTWSVAKKIVREQGLGLRGLNKGLYTTVTRNGVFNMVFFGFYHSVKGIVNEFQDPLKEFLRKVSIGFTSGVLASCANIPFDVAKSRIQAPQPKLGVIKYKSTFRTILNVYREEGFLALYKGLLAKVIRMGPGGAIVLIVYDYVYAFLETKFDNS